MKRIEKALRKLPSVAENAPRKRGWPKGKKRGPRTAKDMAKADKNGWMPGPHSKKVTPALGWKTPKSKRARMAAQILAKHGINPPPRADGIHGINPPPRADGIVEINRLRAENDGLRHILGRLLVNVALKLKAQGEFITF